MDEKILANKLFFSKEAAEYLNISTQRLNKLVIEGKIKPLKKSPSGTLFHIDELNERKKELEIFTQVCKRGEGNMFKIDTKVKNEALNYATLMNVLKETEHTLEPKFDTFSKSVDTSLPLTSNDVIAKYCKEFCVQKEYLIKEYNKAYQMFLSLRENDEIIKRGSQDYPPLLLEAKEQAPRFLYIRGRKSLLFERRTVALVDRDRPQKRQKIIQEI